MRQARMDESAYESHDGDHGGFSGQWSPHCVDCQPVGSPLGRLIAGAITQDEFMRESNAKRKRNGLPPLRRPAA
jgi:hypothetical protein